MSGQYKQRSCRGQQTNGKQQANAQNTGMLKSCPSCYIKHDRKNGSCRAIVCRKCEVKGHIEAVCMVKTAAQSQTEQSARTVENSVLSVLTDASEPHHSVHAVSDSLFQRVNKKVWIKTVVNGHDAMFQRDTGTTCSIVNLQGYQSLGSLLLLPVSTHPKAYRQSELQIKGQCSVSVKVGDVEKQNLKLFVVNPTQGSNLFGLDWSDKFGLSQQGLAILTQGSCDITCTVTGSNLIGLRNKIAALSSKYSDVFKAGLGRCKK
ncbi:uncharacterized protein [Watersipora subatra]|uniref:uncharacterized protein n=1 Tax=Watersipora subatra TaxID=2589382 RepID=UPI00355C0BD2